MVTEQGASTEQTAVKYPNRSAYIKSVKAMQIWVNDAAKKLNDELGKEDSEIDWGTVAVQFVKIEDAAAQGFNAAFKVEHPNG